eukprot:6212509-Pleurochrysis_carterae.AAC.1
MDYSGSIFIFDAAKTLPVACILPKIHVTSGTSFTGRSRDDDCSVKARAALPKNQSIEGKKTISLSEWNKLCPYLSKECSNQAPAWQVLHPNTSSFVILLAHYCMLIVTRHWVAGRPFLYGLARAPLRGDWVRCRGFRATAPTSSHRPSGDATFVSSSWPRSGELASPSGEEKKSRD